LLIFIHPDSVCPNNIALYQHKITTNGKKIQCLLSKITCTEVNYRQLQPQWPMHMLGKLDGCIVLNEHNHLKSVRYMQRVFPWSWMQTASRSLQPFLLGSLGDRRTDRPRYSVGNNRRRTQWKSQILLLSTATTGIYWSSRLHWSDQLYQSAAIFSCETRRVALYLVTHCNIGSKRMLPTGVLKRWDNCLLIYWCTSCLKQLVHCK